MGWSSSQRGLVHTALITTVGLSWYPASRRRCSTYKGGDTQLPAMGITTHHRLLLLPEERPRRSKVGTSDNSLLLDSPWLKEIEPMLAILITALGLSRDSSSFRTSAKQPRSQILNSATGTSRIAPRAKCGLQGRRCRGPPTSHFSSLGQLLDRTGQLGLRYVDFAWSRAWMTLIFIHG